LFPFLFCIYEVNKFTFYCCEVCASIWSSSGGWLDGRDGGSSGRKSGYGFVNFFCCARFLFSTLPFLTACFSSATFSWLSDFRLFSSKLKIVVTQSSLLQHTGQLSEQSSSYMNKTHTGKERTSAFIVLLIMMTYEFDYSYYYICYKHM